MVNSAYHFHPLDPGLGFAGSPTLVGLSRPEGTAAGTGGRTPPRPDPTADEPTENRLPCPLLPKKLFRPLSPVFPELLELKLKNETAWERLVSLYIALGSCITGTGSFGTSRAGFFSLSRTDQYEEAVSRSGFFSLLLCEK